MKPLVLLPNRPHLGCSDLCERCIAAQESTESDLKPVIEAGLQTFFETVRGLLPRRLRSIDFVSTANDFELEQLVSQVSEFVTDCVFDEWNKNRPLLKHARPRKRLVAIGEISNHEMDHHGSSRKAHSE